MHIDTEIATATSAVAITVGMNFAANGSMLFDWAAGQGMGGIELYHEIGELAVLSCKLADEVAACPDFARDGFPGVYAYEVEEPLGYELAALIKEGELDEAGFDAAIVQETLGRLATEYFDKSQRLLPHTDALIFAFTGFSRAKAVQMGWGEQQVEA